MLREWDCWKGGKPSEKATAIPWKGTDPAGDQLLEKYPMDVLENLFSSSFPNSSGKNKSASCMLKRNPSGQVPAMGGQQCNLFISICEGKKNK